MRRTTVVNMLYAIWLVTASETLMAQPTNTTHINSENECLIPFHMIRKLMAFEVIVNGISGYLYLDTAIDGLVINAKYFKSGSATEILMSSNGSPLSAGNTNALVQAGCLSMGFKDAKVMSIDHLVINEPVRILGLVGCALFNGFELRIDYRSKTLRLFQLNKAGMQIRDNSPFPSPDFSMPFHFKGPWPVVQARIGAQNLSLVLDTGASVNVLHSRLYKRLSPFSRFVQEISLRTWDKDTSEVPYTKVSNVMLGDVSLDTMSTVWYNISILNAEFSGPPVSGVLGQELLKQYSLSFNFTTRMVSFYRYGP